MDKSTVSSAALIGKPVKRVKLPAIISQVTRKPKMLRLLPGHVNCRHGERGRISPAHAQKENVNV
ncbi:hypothetical protein [Sodalis sp. dw_96]|uniref:hypothetical protein n=1 Tax=Sodalis sp. dw_96 TaxID=2719794 RepID=UPI001BD27FDC|nr:hypothetical protein [Sodalis sp. dw_96]